MASNDYYDSFNRYNKQDNPLPPLPVANSPHMRPTASTPAPTISPVSSPFEDHAYPDYPAASKPTPSHSGDTGYHGAAGGHQHQNPYHDSSDPFTDHNAIPLHSQTKLDGSPTRYNADPEARFPQQKKKKGWFSGQITWVVYILTVVQISVFIGELIKNGTSKSSLCAHNIVVHQANKTPHSRPHKIPH
jgi:hypothetical protein